MPKDPSDQKADSRPSPEQMTMARQKAGVGKGLKNDGKYKEARAELEGALEMMEQAGASPEERVPVLLDLSHANLRLGNIDRCMALAEEAMRSIALPGLPIGLKGEMTMQYGIALTSKGDLVEGLKNLERALALFETAGDKVGVAKACRNIGNVYAGRSVFGKALAYYSRALKLHDELGMMRDRWYTLYNVALVKRDQALYSDSFSDFEEMLRYFKGTDDLFMMSRSLANMGVLRLAMGKYDEALRYIDDSSRINKELGEQWVEAMNIVNKAEVLLAMGDVKGARTVISDSTEAIMGTGSEEAKGLALRVRGMVLREEGQFDKAEEDFALGELVFEGRGFGVDLARLYIEWALTALAAKKRGKAVALFGKARAIYRRLSLPIKERELDTIIHAHGL